jgi:mannosyltransferase OCH1-like enzyme
MPRPVYQWSFDLLKKIYDKNILNLMANSTTTIIPKKIHQIWIGPNPLPEKFKWIMKTWQDKHPDWEYKLWTNEDLKNFNLENQAIFDRFENWGAKCDIFRYEILYRFGGVVLDIDIECLKRLDELNCSYNFYSCLMNYNDEIAIGLIGSVPGHPILYNCIQNIKRINNFSSDWMNIIHNTGPVFFTRNVMGYLLNNWNDNKIIILPSIYFYPFTSSRLKEFWDGKLSREQIISEYVKPESYGIHYWANSWYDANEPLLKK